MPRSKKRKGVKRPRSTKRVFNVVRTDELDHLSQLTEQLEILENNLKETK